MRIAFTGDLHYPTTKKHQIRSMVDKIAQKSPDVAVLLGDISEVGQNPKCFNSAIRKFTSVLTCPVLVIPGNHDLWVGQTAIWDDLPWNSYGLYTSELPKRARDEGAFWLECENWIDGEVAVIGGYLHYDYSSADKNLMLPDEFYQVRKNKVAVNLDGKFLLGLPGDKAFAVEIGEKFRHRLQYAHENHAVTKMIVATHVPIFEEHMVRRYNNREWSLGNAYFGNFSHTDLVLSYEKVKLVVSGHTHYGKDVEIDRDGTDTIRAICLSSDYHNPEYVIVEV